MQPVLPPIKWAGHIVQYLFEFGPGRGEGPIEAEHIPGIEHALEIKLKSWEKRLLLRLSKDFKAESYAATKPGAKPPWPEAEKQWKVAQMRNIDRKLDEFL